MIWIDYVLTGLIALSAIAGLLTGIKQQSFSLGCWLIAAGVGFGFSREFTFLLPVSITDPAARLAAGFVVLCVATVLLGAIIGKLLGEVIISTRLTLLDRLGGIILGITHGGLWITLIVIVAGLSVLPYSPWWHKAKLLPPFQTIALWLHQHFPSYLLENIHYR